MKRIIVLSVAALLFYVNATAQSTTKTIDSVLSLYYKHGMFNGTALVYQYGRPVLVKGYGYRDVAKKLPNDSNTVFQIGSVTKTFTSVMIMMLQEQGKLNVKDKLTKYFPDYPDGDKTTIENLLTHTSGIYNYTEDTAFANSGMYAYRSRKEMMALFKDKLTGIEPGSKFSYSNSNYMLLGYIIEDVTGKTYYAALRDMILQPLGMKNTGCNFSGLKNKNKATGYYSIDDMNGMKAPVVDSSVSYAAGCIYTTVTDLYKLADAVHHAKLISPENWKLITTPFKEYYGYGWMIGEAIGKKSIGHNGSIHGFGSNLFLTPDDAATIILISNCMDNDQAQIRRNITSVLNNKRLDLPEFRTEMKLASSVLKDYVGVYQLAPGFNITITMEGEKMYAQATGQTKLRIYSQRRDYFFFKVVNAQISFHRNVYSKVEKLELIQNGRILPGMKKE